MTSSSSSSTYPSTSTLSQIHAVLSEREQLRRILSASPDQRVPDVSSLLPPATNMGKARKHFSTIKSRTEGASGNRYLDVLAYDRTAVRVFYKRRRERLAESALTKKGVEGGYLNANVIKLRNSLDPRWWVACQAPIPSTIHPFLLSIVTRSASLHPSLPARPRPSSPQQTRKAILIQLTDFIERGTRKADPYLPIPSTRPKTLRYDPPLTFSDRPSLTLRIFGESVDRVDVGSTVSNYKLASLRHITPNTSKQPQPVIASGSASGTTGIGKGKTKAGHEPDEEIDEEIDILFYHFKGWPDHGVPTNPTEITSLRNLVSEVERIRMEDPSLSTEVWVHCSAGVGRTGTFIALSALLHPQQIPSASSSARATLKSALTSSSSSSSSPTQFPSSPLGHLPSPLDKDKVAMMIDDLREQRGLMVQTKEQTELVYQMVWGQV